MYALCIVSGKMQIKTYTFTSINQTAIKHIKPHIIILITSYNIVYLHKHVGKFRIQYAN